MKTRFVLLKALARAELKLWVTNSRDGLRQDSLRRDNSRVGQNLEIQEDKCNGLQKIWDKTGQEFCRDIV